MSQIVKKSIILFKGIKGVRPLIEKGLFKLSSNLHTSNIDLV